MLTPHIRMTIDQVLRSILGPWGYAGFEAEARLDSDGDAAIFIKARFDPETSLPPSATTTLAMVALRDKLLAADDGRIPYLDYVFPKEPMSDEAA